MKVLSWFNQERLPGFFKGEHKPCTGVRIRDSRPVQTTPKRFWQVVSINPLHLDNGPC